MKEVWIVIIIDIPGGCFPTVVGEDSLLFVFPDGLRERALKRAMTAI